MYPHFLGHCVLLDDSQVSLPVHTTVNLNVTVNYSFRKCLIVDSNCLVMYEYIGSKSWEFWRNSTFTVLWFNDTHWLFVYHHHWLNQNNFFESVLRSNLFFVGIKCLNINAFRRHMFSIKSLIIKLLLVFSIPSYFSENFPQVNISNISGPWSYTLEDKFVLA